MVDVSVRENDTVQLSRLAVKFFVLPVSLGAVSLKEPAVEQQSQGVGLDQMLAAGDLAGGAEKSDLHENFQNVNRKAVTW
jgi:hypothetical protein